MIPNLAVRRLSVYLRRLESLRGADRRTISSRELAGSLGLTDAQVRKDLAYFGQFGQPGVGYRVDDLIAQVRRILGTDRTWDMLLVGAGNLGRALMSHPGFEQKGFRLVAAYDVDPAKIGRKYGNVAVRPLAELPDGIPGRQVKLGIIAVPAEAAQRVTDLLVLSGIRGILNFAPISLVVPRHVWLHSIDLAAQLEQLSFHIGFATTRLSSPNPMSLEQRPSRDS